MISEDDLKELAGFSPDNNLVVSLYLDVDGAKYPRAQDCEKTLHGLLGKAAQDWLDDNALADKEQRKALKVDLERIREHVTGHWRRNGTKGLVLFSCAAENFWRVFELPMSAPSALIVGREPYAKTLTALLNKYARFGLVSVDRKRSRFFIMHMGSIAEEHGVMVDERVPDQVKEGEWASLRQNRIARHVDDHVMHHLREIAQDAFDFFRGRDCDYLIICGPVELLPKFEKELHPYLRERVVGEIHLDPQAPAAEFALRAGEIEHLVRAESESDLLRRLEDATGPGGLAVNGLEETMAALVRGQVDTLLIAEGYATNGFVCYTDHYLDSRAGVCPVCGQSLDEAEDVIEDMVQSAINQNVQIEYITSESRFVQDEKVGALLRYAQRRQAS